MRNPFAAGNGSESWYDLFFDYGLIEASFAQQYGIRLRREEDMTFDEFRTLLAGLNGDTPLGAVVRIRSEKDRKVIKNFTPEQKRIRAEWSRFRAGQMQKNIRTSRTEYDEAMKGFAEIFRSMAGKGG